MSAPSHTPDPTLQNEKVLIWGAGGAVDQYAVQYAASVSARTRATELVSDIIVRMGGC